MVAHQVLPRVISRGTNGLPPHLSSVDPYILKDISNHQSGPYISSNHHVAPPPNVATPVITTATSSGNLRRSDLAGWRTKSLLPARCGSEKLPAFLPILKLRGLPYFCSERHVLSWFGDIAPHILRLQFIAEVDPLNSGYALVTLDSAESALAAWQTLHKKPISNKRFVEVFALLPPYCPICRRGQTTHLTSDLRINASTTCAFCFTPLSSHGDGGAASIATLRMRKAVRSAAAQSSSFSAESAGLMHTGFLKVPALIYQDANLLTRHEIELFDPERWQLSRPYEPIPCCSKLAPERLYSLASLEHLEAPGKNWTPPNEEFLGISCDSIDASKTLFFDIMDIAGYDLRMLLCEIVEILQFRSSGEKRRRVPQEKVDKFAANNASFECHDEDHRVTPMKIAELGNFLSTRARAYLFVTEVKLKGVLESFYDFFDVFKDQRTSFITVALKPDALPKGSGTIMEMDAFQLTRRRKQGGSNGQKPQDRNNTFRTSAMQKRVPCSSANADGTPNSSGNNADFGDLLSWQGLPSRSEMADVGSLNTAKDFSQENHGMRRYMNRVTSEGQTRAALGRLVRDLSDDPSSPLMRRPVDLYDGLANDVFNLNNFNYSRDRAGQPLEYIDCPPGEEIFYNNNFDTSGPVDPVHLEKILNLPLSPPFKAKSNPGTVMGQEGSSRQAFATLPKSVRTRTGFETPRGIRDLRRNWSARTTMTDEAMRNTFAATSRYRESLPPSQKVSPNQYKLSRATTEDPMMTVLAEETLNLDRPLSSAMVARFLSRVSDNLLVAECKARRIPVQRDYAGSSSITTNSPLKDNSIQSSFSGTDEIPGRDRGFWGSQGYHGNEVLLLSRGSTCPTTAEVDQSHHVPTSSNLDSKIRSRFMTTGYGENWMLHQSDFRFLADDRTGGNPNGRSGASRGRNIHEREEETNLASLKLPRYEFKTDHDLTMAASVSKDYANVESPLDIEESSMGIFANDLIGKRHLCPPEDLGSADFSSDSDKEDFDSYSNEDMFQMILGKSPPVESYPRLQPKESWMKLCSDVCALTPSTGTASSLSRGQSREPSLFPPDGLLSRHDRWGTACGDNSVGGNKENCWEWEGVANLLESMAKRADVVQD